MRRRDLLFAPAALLQGRSGKIRAGAATSNITPWLGLSLAGNMNDRKAAFIHDELLVRAIALDNGRTRLAIAVVDSCAVPRAVFDAAKELIHQHTGIPIAQILTSATHTHSAPAAAHLFQSEPDPAYTKFLTTRIADAVRMAVARLEPARIGYGVGREERLVFNRRYVMKPGSIPPNPFGSDDQVLMNPPAGNENILKAAGPIDPDVTLLAGESIDGKPIFALCSYALHYMGGHPGTHVSADYFGSWAAAMQRMAGSAFVPVLANACSGNINGVNFLKAPRVWQPYEQMNAYADILAAEAFRTWKALQWEDAVELNGSIEEIELATRQPSLSEIESAKKLLASEGVAPAGGYRKRETIYARETVLLPGEIGPRVKTLVQAMRIGNLGIGTMPGEAFVELGLAVKQASPFQTTMMIELANDYRGYIPTEEAFAVGGYETWRAKSSYLERRAAGTFVKSALGQLEKLVR